MGTFRRGWPLLPGQQAGTVVCALKCFGENTCQALSLVPLLIHSHSHTDTWSSSLAPDVLPMHRDNAHVSLPPPSLEHHLPTSAQSWTLGLDCFHSAEVLPRVKVSLAPHWLSPHPQPHSHTQSEPLVPPFSLLGRAHIHVPQRTTQPRWKPWLWLCSMGCWAGTELSKMGTVNWGESEPWYNWEL